MHPAESPRPIPRPPEAVAPSGVAPPIQHESRRVGGLGVEAHGSSVFAPLMVFFLAWLAWAVFQAVQLHEENKSLQSLRANQQQQVQQAQRVRQTLDRLALETQKLADAGNANAKLVIEELRKRGITVNRPSPESKAPGK
jgi:hypothetical protein